MIYQIVQCQFYRDKGQMTLARQSMEPSLNIANTKPGEGSSSSAEEADTE